MKLKNLAYSALAAIALSGMAVTSASAAALINFDQDNGTSPSGSLSYDGEGGALKGRKIRFDSIRLQGKNPPSGNQDSLFCQGCIMGFVTGPNTSEGPDDWRFAAGGRFVLGGSVFEQNSAGEPTGQAIASGELLRGTFTGSPRITQTGPDSLNFNANGTDAKNEDLLRYFGIDPSSDFTFASSAISFGDATFDGEGGFTAVPTAADLNNRFQPGTSVPEPKELGIFGLGLALLLIGLFTRRRNELS